MIMYLYLYKNIIHFLAVNCFDSLFNFNHIIVNHLHYLTDVLYFLIEYYNKDIIYQGMKKNDNKNKHDNPLDVACVIEKKINFFRDVIQRTFVHAQNNQYREILSVNEVNTCIDRLTEINNTIQTLNHDDSNKDLVINKLQLINNDLSSVLKTYGTLNLDDLLVICFGNNLIDSEASKFELLKNIVVNIYISLSS